MKVYLLPNADGTHRAMVAAANQRAACESFNCSVGQFKAHGGREQTNAELAAPALSTPGVVWKQEIHYTGVRKPWFRRDAAGNKVEATRTFRITGDGPGAGAEFSVYVGATEDEIAVAAHDCVVEYLSYGWEETTAGEVQTHA